MQIYRVILPVADIEKGQAFYEFLLDKKGTRVSRGRHYFDCGGVILAVFDPRADTDDRDAKPNPDHIYFAVSDLAAVHARAQQAGCQEVDEEIQTRPWGETSFYAKDPFGNPICFVDEKTVFTG